jgi:hypothetical protein
MTAPPTDPKSAIAPVAPEPAPKDDAPPKTSGASPNDAAAKRPREIGGPKGPEPTRYGDWERNGRVSDF